MKQMKKTILVITATDREWVMGQYKGLDFGAKIYEEGSVFGINGGRVSKLHIKDASGTWIFNYDRGIDIDSKIGYELAAVLEVAV